MLYFKNILSLTFLSALMLAISCSPTSTEITGSWMNPEVNKNYDNVLVVAMTENMSVKQSIENDLADELQEKGVNASKSVNVFPPKFSDEQLADKNAILDQVRADRHDAILTVVLLDEETETRYIPRHPGSATYAPVGGRFGFYGNFWGYYTNMYSRMSDPGYYRTDKIYFVETNLYDADTEELVWSAQTETVSPNTIERASEELAEITVNAMAGRNLF